MIREAEKKSNSMVPKNKMKHRAKKMFLCQHRTITRDIKQVVTNMTIMTAKPVAIEQLKILHLQDSCSTSYIVMAGLL